MMNHDLCFSGERLIQFATENLVTEVLIHPQVGKKLKTPLKDGGENLKIGRETNIFASSEFLDIDDPRPIL